ncbi:MAG: 5-formyltetrahydrofolate cyclo-ligase [Ideonella sp.]
MSLYSMPFDATPAKPVDRVLLRAKLRAARDRFVASADFSLAQTELARRLVDVLHQLEPERLGLYWAIQSEFNAVAACAADPDLASTGLALPWCRRSPLDMHFRAWNGTTPRQVDECGIAGCDGPAVVPDVVLVPCLGFTTDGFRLGYGAGYFDRWQAAHPQVTTVGVAWSLGQLDASDFVPQQHDQPLMMVVTERGVIG